MDGALIIFVLTLAVYLPMAVALLYVWWKYGKGEKWVALAQGAYLLGSAALLGFMIVI
jgi:hypothetical protein